MSTSTQPELIAVLDEPHERALAALQEGADDLLAVLPWCCTHLAAVDTVLYPLVRRRLPDGARRVRVARTDDHLLQQALCRLERRLTGAAQLDAVPLEPLVHEALVALRVHAQQEEDLLERLLPLLAEDEERQLAARLATATAAGPTRPHPHTRHTPLAPLVARLDAVVDHVRDALDNRVDPSGRRHRAVLPTSRWGCYAMGAPYPPAPRR